MAVVFRSKDQAFGSVSGTSVTITEPSGAANGDYLIAFAVRDGQTINAPGGWTDLYSGTQGAPRYRVSYILRGGSAPSLTWTWSVNDGGWREVHVICVRSDVSQTISLDSQSASGSGGTGTNADPPVTTAVASTSLAICGGLSWGHGGSDTYTAPSGYTLRTDNTAGGPAAAMATKALSAAGAENPGAFSGTTASSDLWNGFTITFTDSSGGAATVSVPPLSMQFVRGKNQNTRRPS